MALAGMLAVSALLAASPAEAEPARALAEDPVLASVVREALERSPEHARARAAAEAERFRVPQVGALPDPSLSLGIQNDGFKEIQIGKMETSYWQIMATQPFPWPGKLGAREEAARAQARVAEAELERVRLSTAAAVERVYLDLLLVRGQVALLAKLEALWTEAEVMARTRYEVGEGPQADLIRAQLERTRLAQQRIALETEERTRLQTLNRLRVHPLDEPLDTPRPLAEMGDPAVPTPEEAVSDAVRRSPDLAQARLSAEAAERRVDAARRDRYPDFSATAGIMLRGSIEPMWLASIGISIPVFSASKQSRAVDESTSRREAETHGEEAVRQVVALRAHERQTLLEALSRTNRLYRGALLIQSDGAVRSTLAQYRVGKASFAGVLDVLRGLVADEGGYLESLAQAQRVAIAQREVSLEAPPGLGGALGGRSMPGAGATGARAGPAAQGGGNQAQPAQGGAMPSGM